MHDFEIICPIVFVFFCCFFCGEGGGRGGRRGGGYGDNKDGRSIHTLHIPCGCGPEIQIHAFMLSLDQHVSRLSRV